MINSHSDAQSSLKQAAEFIKSGNLAEAKPLIVNVLKTDPNNAPAWYLSSFLISDTNKKIHALQRALAIDPEYKPAGKALEKLSLFSYLTDNESASSATRQTSPKSWTNSAILIGIASIVMLILVIIILFISRRGNQVALLPTINNISGSLIPIASTVPSTVTPKRMPTNTVTSSAILLSASTSMIAPTASPRSGLVSQITPANSVERIIYIKPSTGRLYANLDSSPGEWIGRGQGKFSFQGKAQLVESNGIMINIEPTSFSDWSFKFYAPILIAGKTYQIVTDSVDNHLPEISISSSGHACNASTGNFKVEQQAQALIIAFKQICEGNPTHVLQGTLRFTADSIPTPTIALDKLFKITPSTGDFSADFYSSLDDPIGRGKGNNTGIRGRATARIIDEALVFNVISNSPTDPNWIIIVSAPAMQVGQSYDVLPTSSSTNRELPFFKIQNGNRSCSQISGEFTIKQMWPNIVISFSQRCESDANKSLTGTLTFSTDTKFIATATLPPEKVFRPVAEEGYLTVQVSARPGHTKDFGLEKITFEGPAKLLLDKGAVTFSIKRPDNPDEEWVFTFFSPTNEIGKSNREVASWPNEKNEPAMAIKSPYSKDKCQNLQNNFTFETQIPEIAIDFGLVCDVNTLSGRIIFHSASSGYSTITPVPQGLFTAITSRGQVYTELYSSFQDRVGGGMPSFTVQGEGSLTVNNGEVLITMVDGNSSRHGIWNFQFNATPLEVQHPYKNVHFLPNNNTGLPSMHLTSPTATCDQVDGEFEIEQQIPTIVISFTQICNQNPNSEFKGKITFTSALSLTQTATLSAR